jgi:uncharacterized protein
MISIAHSWIKEALLIACLFPSIAIAEDPPDSWPSSGEVSAVAAKPGAKLYDEQTLLQDYCFILLRFYQNVLSVVTVSHCPMIPSCSKYSMDAVRKHGAFVGVAMTADRLYHEGSERYWTPIVRGNGRTRFLDPVENNDFWWYHEN